MGECRSKADLSAFFYILTKTLVEDLILSLANVTESVLITQPERTIQESALALKALSESETFIANVMIPLVDRKAREGNSDFDKESVSDMAVKKISTEKRKWENRLLEAISKEIKGVLAALVKSLVSDKQITMEDDTYLENMLDELRDRGTPSLARIYNLGMQAGDPEIHQRARYDPRDKAGVLAIVFVREGRSSNHCTVRQES